MWPFDSLLQSLQSTFSSASTDYNQVHRLTEKLEQENQQQYQQSLVVSGLKRMFVNRYNGVLNVRTIVDQGKQGAFWAYYFGMAPNLSRDVKASAESWAWSLLTVPAFSVRKIVEAGSTLGGTTSQDIQRLSMSAQNRVNYESKVLAVSTGASMVITQMLKQASRQVNGEWQRLALRSATRTWQASSVLAFMYGLSRLNDAIESSGPFASDLRVRRDTFLQGHKLKIESGLRRFGEHLQETAPLGLLD